MTTADLQAATLYWLRYVNPRGEWVRLSRTGPPGAELAALRRGLGREPGEVPAMWPFYTQANDRGELTPEYAAEHAALSLYGLHQQSQRDSMHRDGVSIGKAVAVLRRRWGGRSAQVQEDKVDWTRVHPIDRRFAAAATATSFSELVLHLRGLVTQLRGISQPLDYTQLYEDLLAWHSPVGATRVRRRWGMEYFTNTGSAPSDEPIDVTDTEKPK